MLVNLCIETGYYGVG